jgi:hypothetical protein
MEIRDIVEKEDRTKGRAALCARECRKGSDESMYDVVCVPNECM